MSLASCSGLHFFSRLKEDGQLSPERSCILKQPEGISTFSQHLQKISNCNHARYTTKRLENSKENGPFNSKVLSDGIFNSTRIHRGNQMLNYWWEKTIRSMELLLDNDSRGRQYTVQPRCKCLGFVTYLLTIGFASIRRLKNR